MDGGMNIKREILVVDDDPDIRCVLDEILQSHGYVVHTARNGDEALKLIEGRLPDLIILDIMMTTDTEGFDVAVQIKSNPASAKMPIIMLTSFLEKIRREGPEHFENILGEEWPATWLFEKPVDFKKLLAKIEDVLAGASARGYTYADAQEEG